MSWLKNKAWPWLRRNWKWVLFPVGILTLLIGAGAAAAAIKDYADPPEDLDEKTREALRKLRMAELEHDKKVAELEQEHKERLKELSEDQQQELVKLQGKPIDEVVTWFDNL